jgi:predicted signal transduction protein with EAL and GGDEF domain
MSQTVFPWFQPIIEIASGRVAGFEALARRTGPTGQVESAADIFSDPGRSAQQRLEVDRSVRRQALERFCALEGTQFLSLNLSPEWIDSLNTLDDQPTLTMIHEAGLSPNRVVLEITEHNGNIDLIRQRAEHYRNAGVRVAYDDFVQAASIRVQFCRWSGRWALSWAARLFAKELKRPMIFSSRCTAMQATCRATCLNRHCPTLSTPTPPWTRSGNC